MKKIISIMLIISMLSISLSGCSSKKEGKKDDPEAKIAIVTESKYENLDGYTAAYYISNMYKSKKENGVTNDEIEHVVMPKNFAKNIKKSDEVIKKIIDDKDIKAVVFSSKEKYMIKYVNQLKESRKDMIVLGADLDITEEELSKNLDLSYISDTTLNGQNTVQLAKEMGAEAFILYYSNKDLEDNVNLSKKISEIEFECREQNLTLEKVKVKDINSKEDEYDVKKFLIENINSQIYKYGKDINLFGTNHIIDDVILRRAIKDTLIVSETSDGCMVNDMTDLYRILRKTLDNGDFRGVTKYISDRSLKYEMNGRLGGIIMPSTIFTVYAAADTAISIVEDGIDVKKAYNSYYIEKNIYEKEGITAAFEETELGSPNVKIVSIDQTIY